MLRSNFPIGRWTLVRTVVLGLLVSPFCYSQSGAGTGSQRSPAPSEPEAAQPPAADEPGDTTIFSHSESSRYWLSGQANVVFQWHPAFRAPYSGPSSLTPEAQSATTRVLTLYTAYQLTPTLEVFADVEDSTGSALGNAIGLAGFTNLDAVREAQGASLPRAPYLARLMLRKVIPLSGERVSVERGPLALETSLPARRLEFRIGKFSLPDFFDTNTAGSDSHLQFLNLTGDNNGAWDYAANTRGYTDAAMIEFDDRRWSLRFAEALMPKVANGINLDADVARARAENLEGELHGNWLRGRAGTLRFLSYVNHADMGSYRKAVHDFLQGLAPLPDIIATRRQGRVRYGFGLNFEQKLTSDIGVFGRWGWSDGRNESFAYTEVDRTLELGAWLQGEKWHRRLDRAGGAFVSNAIVADHRIYLALGGIGFLLGDGRLNYGREQIVEAYYTAHLWRGVFASFDLQGIWNPGYNRDRGPVLVPALRLHLDL